MRYVTSIERLIRKQVACEAAAKIVSLLLERRFGPLPEPVRARLAAAGEEDLEQWAGAVLTAPSLDAVFEPLLH